ncbi:MAG: hypothetical protein ACI8ZB_000457 [Desulforhopalus sp.]|jgi:hypothetical protein
MQKLVQTLLFIGLITMTATGALAGDHRIGGGANYWVAIDDIEVGDNKLDDDGLSFFGSYQYWPGLFGLEVDVEFQPDRFDESAISPQAYLLVGKGIYGGIGIGTTYTDGDFVDEPFFALKAGFNIELLPGIYGDIYGTYRFNDTADFDNEDTDIDTDTVFLGLAVRIAL